MTGEEVIGRRGAGPTKARAVRAFTGRLLPQLPVRDRFHCFDFGEARKFAVFGPASDRSGAKSRATDDETNR